MVRFRDRSPLLPTSTGAGSRSHQRALSLAARIAGLAALGCICALALRSGRFTGRRVETLGVPISLSPGAGIKVQRKLQILRDTSRLTSKDHYDVHYDEKTGIVTMTDKKSGVTTVADTNSGTVEHRNFIRGVRPHGTLPHKARRPNDDWEYHYDPKTGDLTMKNLKTGATTLTNQDKGIIKPVNEFPQVDYFLGLDGNMSSMGLNGEIMDGAGTLERARPPHNSGDPHSYLPGFWKPSHPRVRSEFDGVAESPGQATFRRHFDNWFKRYLGMGDENEYEAAYRIYNLYPNETHPPMKGWDKEGGDGWGIYEDANNMQ